MTNQPFWFQVLDKNFYRNERFKNILKVSRSWCALRQWDFRYKRRGRRTQVISSISSVFQSKQLHIIETCQEEKCVTACPISKTMNMVSFNNLILFDCVSIEFSSFRRRYREFLSIFPKYRTICALDGEYSGGYSRFGEK